MRSATRQSQKTEQRQQDSFHNKSHSATGFRLNGLNVDALCSLIRKILRFFLCDKHVYNFKKNIEAVYKFLQLFLCNVNVSCALQRCSLM